jgi:VWFA-related protein
MILLDARNTKYVDYQARALPQVKKILGQIPPGELVALYAYGDGAQVKTLHDFSSDKESLLATLGPYHGEWTLHDAWLPPITDPPDARVLAMFNRVRTVDTLGALEALANHVKGVPGRKNLLWVTAGFVVKDSNSEQGVALVRATTAMNDAGVSLYPIDARGLSTSRTAYMVVNTLERMSDATGGVAYHDRNDLDRGVRLALDDARDAYWLTYSPNNLALDGAYHNIRIRTARPGIQIRFRRGYYAPGRKESADLALEDHITRLMSSPLDSSGIGVQATIEPASDHISLAIHIDPVDLNLASVGGKWTGALHLEAVQLGAAGERLGGASQAAELNLAPATYRQALQQGLSFHMKFPRSPAAISVRIGVADDRGDNVGSLSVPLPTPR